jgi:hypothetical protein
MKSSYHAAGLHCAILVMMTRPAQMPFPTKAAHLENTMTSLGIITQFFRVECHTIDLCQNSQKNNKKYLSSFKE